MSRSDKVLSAIRDLISEDEQSDSERSNDSGDLAHVPLPELDLNLEVLSINEMATPNQKQNATLEQVLEGLASQITTLNATIQQMSSQQQTHENLLKSLTQPAGTPTNNLIQAAAGDIFRIPDPIKSIPVYDGSRKQLQAWLTSAENTLSVFKNLVPPQTYSIYVQAVLNKITGNAKDAVCLAGNPLDFDDVKNILLETFGDRQELATYKAQLWANKQNNDMNIHKYYRRTKEIVQNIKTIARQNADYNAAWSAINKFIDEDAIAAFTAGLKHSYFGYAQAAKPENIESAYAFLCKFTSAEKISATQQSQKNTSSNRAITNDDAGRHQKYPKEYQQNKNQLNPNRQNSSQPRPGNQDYKNNVEQMEVDPSLRSRLTLNRKIVNNQEIDSDDEDVDELETNFSNTPTSDTET